MNTQTSWRQNEHHLVGDMINAISLSPKAIAKVKVANSFWALFSHLDETGRGRTPEARGYETTFDHAYTWLVGYCKGFGLDRDESNEAMPLVLQAGKVYGWY